MGTTLNDSEKVAYGLICRAYDLLYSCDSDAAIDALNHLRKAKKALDNV